MGFAPVIGDSGLSVELRQGSEGFAPQFGPWPFILGTFGGSGWIGENPWQASISAEKRRNYADARRHTSEFAKSGGDRFLATLRTAWLFAEEGNHSEAARFYNEASRLTDYHPLGSGQCEQHGDSCGSFVKVTR